MNFGKENQPRFIVGLKMAKNILVQLKKSKVGEMREQSVRNGVQVREVVDGDLTLQRPYTQKQQQQVSQVIAEQVPKSKTQSLCQKINMIGQQLFNTHNQCETYNLIFQKLTDYYRQKLPIIQENEKLKKKKYQLQELLDLYEKKIENCHKQTENLRSCQEIMKKQVRQLLTQYISQQVAKGSEEPHSNIKVKVPKISLKIDQPAEPPKQNTLSLNYEALKKQVSRKPQNRKVDREEQELRKPLYHSQLYTL